MKKLLTAGLVAVMATTASAKSSTDIAKHLGITLGWTLTCGLTVSLAGCDKLPNVNVNKDKLLINIIKDNMKADRDQLKDFFK